MNKIFLCTMLLTISFPVLADILLPPQEEAALRQRMEQGQKNCPKDKPLFDGEECHACNELATIHSGRYAKCEEVCPNRKGRYECGPSCILKEAPGPDYIYVGCHGWEKRCTSGLQGSDGKCYTCSDVEAIRDIKNYDEGIPISEKDCLSCQNTQYIDGFGCAPACPKDKPLFVAGVCRACDLEERSGYVRAGCDKCPNRFEYNNGCYQKCPDDKPLLGLHTGKCFSCTHNEFSGCPIENGQKTCWQPRDYAVIGCAKCKNTIYKTHCVDLDVFNEAE